MKLVTGLPEKTQAVPIRHYRVDEKHSNAFGLWKSMKAPQSPTAEQFADLEAAGQLALLDAARWSPVKQAQ